MENFLFEGMASIMQMLVFAIYLKAVLGLRRSVYWLSVCWGLIEVIDRAVIEMIDSVWIKGIIYLLLIEITAFWMCKGFWKKRLLLTLDYIANAVILEVILIGIIVILEIYDLETIMYNEKISYIISIFTQLLLFIFLQIVNYYWGYRLNSEIQIKSWQGIFFIYIGCFVTEIIFTVHIVNKNSFSIEKIFILIIFICLNFFCYCFYSILSEKNRVELETAVYQEQINIYREKYQSILKTKKEIESFQHDINNHFGILYKLCQEGQKGENSEKYLSEIEKYLKKLSVTYDKGLYNINSENLMIDSIIAMKTEYAVSKGIAMKTELYIPSDMFFDSLDLVVVLGNLLDNAIEACEKLKTGRKPEIILKIGYRMSNLIIHIENTYEEENKQSESLAEDVLPQTTKEDKRIHGIGMKNVKKVVEQYNGVMEWRRERGVFFVDVLLFGFDKRGIKEEGN